MEFKGRGRLELINLTEGKAISPRADFIVFDEERKADHFHFGSSGNIWWICKKPSFSSRGKAFSGLLWCYKRIYRLI